MHWKSAWACLGKDCWAKVKVAAETLPKELPPNNYPGILRDYVAEVESLKFEMQMLKDQLSTCDEFPIGFVTPTKWPRLEYISSDFSIVL